MSDDGVKVSQEHWEATHAVAPRMRLPSTLLVATRDLQKLLARYIRPGMKVLEIGCAPGKQLAYVAKVLGAEVSGIDYSSVGVKFTDQLFAALDINADVRCEDMFNSSFPTASFDVVYSIGVVEHFDDPGRIIRIHAEFLRPGGTAVIALPNYGGIYGRLQSWFDPDNLAIHNVEMMSPEALAKLAPQDDGTEYEVFRFGRVNPWLINWERRMPRILSRALCLAGNAIAFLQPVRIDALSPLLVLRITR